MNIGIGILIILVLLSSAINLIFLVIIRWDQRDDYNNLYRIQDRIEDDLIDIRKTVRAINKKIDLVVETLEGNI